MADLSCTHSVLPTDWTLAHSVLQPVWQTWKKPFLDLFSTKYSSRLPVYVSLVPDEQTWAVDALSLLWVGLEAFSFPPFALIPQVLQKARLKRPRLFLVAPLWPWMHWFTQLQDLAHASPLPLSISPAGLTQLGQKHGTETYRL